MLETRPPGTARAAVDAAWPDGWQWVLDLRQSFAGLLDAALWLADREAAGDVFDDGGAALNLCLVTSAMQQILSDHLHRHFYDVSPLSGRLGPAAALGNLATAVAIRARQAWVRVSRCDLVELEAELVRLQMEFASAHLTGEVAADTIRRNRNRLSDLRRHRLPASLRRWRLKVPGAFRSMDLYPEDCALLARKAEPLFGDRRTPVLVVGLRTSGLFMAPHAVAALRSDGFSTSSMLTIRPGVPLLRHELLEVRRLAAAGGWALVIDDPTWWGTAYAQSISALAAAGMPQDRICAAVCEIGNQPVLKLLDRRDDLLPHELAKVWAGFRSAPHVLLKRGDWEIDRLLENSAVEQTLNRPEFLTALGADSVSVLSGYHLGAAGEAQAPEFCVPETVPPLRQGRRFHAKKVFEVELLKGARRDRVRVLAKGAGLGFFGVHSLIAGRALNGLVPPVLGLHKGVLYSRWVEDGARPDRNLASALKVGAYVAERARRLALLDAPPSVFEGKAVLTSARRAARVLTRGLGRTGSIAQFRAEEEILSAIRAPRCVVDGQMRPSEWITLGDGSLVKTDFEEHGFDISDRAVVDPLFDIAQAVTAFGFDQRLEQALLRAAGDLGRGAGDRLLVHRLAAGAEELDSLHIELPDHQTADGRRRYAARLAGAEDALTRAVNSYLAGALPVEQPGPAEEVWVLDLDDTLETDRLGFPAQSPAGVRAVRALQRHGARVLLASGRSLAEVTERCQAFQLAGGVAEYGAVAWEACTGRTIPLIDDRSLAELDRLRAAVIETTEFLIDPRYTFSLRLFTHGAKGRRGVDAQAVRELVRRLGLQTLRVTEGWRKTVVVAEGSDKATALHRLLSSLGAGPSVEHAMGDAFTDLEVLRLARRRHAPANAGPELRALRRQLGIAIESRPYQAGVLQAVQRSVHGDRGCEPCDQVPEGALWRLLALQDEGRATKLRYLVDRRSARFIEL